MKAFAIKCSDDVIYNNYIISKLRDMGFIPDCDIFKNKEDEFFYIDDIKIKKDVLSNILKLNECEILNIEDFERKYPFCVTEGVIFMNKYCEILEIKWDRSIGEVLYKLSKPNIWVTSQCLNKYEMMEKENKEPIYYKITKSIFLPTGYEVDCIEDGEIKIKREITNFPKGFDECYDIMGLPQYFGFGRLIDTENLKIARDAYLKLSGYDPMDISITRNFKYKLNIDNDTSLSFPTEEILNIYKYNFSDTIEKLSQEEKQ